ncbi:PQQ-binding-like beta-propeller repeat protein [Streptomyces heilongjiangensis]|uniref:PQQ-binding-like beta-propeller repeat protein n=1 Tax=Streptomyces heilongjiangensis TaxID=945052 RepID=A0ABW1BA35_9ACTN|nr:PQQ-binding-like beta-propeller repeat protein [Streptomyces heilongjiangensis]MDC2947234.1 PQQ-binding-like beta-propeller repeat protein [Streptomyces heilongjiangensis]
MELTDRITRILPVDGVGLLAADVAGRIHLLDDRLRLLRSAPVPATAVPPCGRPVYTVAVAGPWVVTKDKYGTITKWSLDTLDPVDVLDAKATADHDHLVEDEEPSPEISRGIAVWKGRVYVNNGFRQLAVIDLGSFAVERIVPSFTGEVALESVCTDRPGIHAVGDRAGRVHLGSLEDLTFPTVVRVDHGNIHRLVHDRLHDLFWATQDIGTGDDRYVRHGLAVLTPDGQVVHQLPFARNDVEALAFSRDHTRAYVGGFDGVIHVLDNTRPEPRITRTLDGFSHQVSDCAVTEDDALVVLTQDGHLVRTDPARATVTARAPFRPQCVWDLQADPADPRTLYAATDDGVAVVRAGGTAAAPLLSVTAHHVTGLGFTRRIQPVPDGWIGVTWDGKVVRAGRDGGLLWTSAMPALSHTVAVSPDGRRALVATNAGAVELDTATGRTVGLLDVDGLPVWAATYLPTGERVVGTRTGELRAFDAHDTTVTWRLRLRLGEYVKRLWSDAHHLYVTGSDGLKQIPHHGARIERRYVELLDNTVENGAVHAGTVCAVSYGCQIAAYDRHTGELTGLVEDLPGEPKGVAVIRVDDETFLVVGGRGGYLDLYRLRARSPKGALARVRRTFLPRGATRDTR